jgi:glycosyltransferase involved in cell wall biosynthesis
MRVHFCLADMHGPGYYRGYLPLSRMSLIGHACTHGTSMPTLENCQEQGLNVLVGQRLVEPSPTALWQALARHGRRDFALVMDLDDDLWNIDRSNDAHAFFDPERLRRLKENVAVADLITVSTEHLANVVTEHASVPVVVLPNTVPQFLTELVPSHAVADAEGRQVIGEDDLVIGWAGSSTHNRDFGECARSVKRVIQAHPQTIFHCICPVDYTERVASIRGRTHHTAWVNGVENYYRAINFDIGLAPLYPFPFNESKSDIRLLELGALGIPVIASPVGPYLRAFDEGHRGYWLAGNPREWTECLTHLIKEPETRQKLGKEAREWVLGRTTEANAYRWVAAYQQALAGVGTP